MVGFGDSYGISWYGIETYGGRSALTRTLTGSICARIVKAPAPSPPIMDTIARGLAQRFGWLQQGIQAFGLFNKIEYTTGQDLDDHFGAIYGLARLTGESDDYYRLRLQTYLKVLTGCGAIPDTQAVLDTIIGVLGGSQVSSLWPAQAIIEFNTAAIREAKQKQSVIESVLPGMFAAGVTYELRIPYTEGTMTAAIQGLRTLYGPIEAAIATEFELAGAIDALIAYGREMDSRIITAIQGEPTLYGGIRTTLRGERLLAGSCSATVQADVILEAILSAAVQGSRQLTGIQSTAIRGEPLLENGVIAAIARQFELESRLLCRIMLSFDMSGKLTAAVRSHRQLNGALRVRISRRLT